MGKLDDTSVVAVVWFSVIVQLTASVFLAVRKGL